MPPGSRKGYASEFDTLFRSQAERILRDLDVVQREEFEAVKEMARLAREENEALKARIAALEGKPDKRGLRFFGLRIVIPRRGRSPRTRNRESIY